MRKIIVIMFFAISPSPNLELVLEELPEFHEKNHRKDSYDGGGMRHRTFWSSVKHGWG